MDRFKNCQKEKPVTGAEKLFHQIAGEFPAVKEGKMFGSLCMKTSDGKSAAMLWKNHLVIKLDKKDIDKVMKIKGVVFFEPMKGRPMREWLQIPFELSSQWKELTGKSLQFVIKGK